MFTSTPPPQQTPPPLQGCPRFRSLAVKKAAEAIAGKSDECADASSHREGNVGLQEGNTPEKIGCHKDAEEKRAGFSPLGSSWLLDACNSSDDSACARTKKTTVETTKPGTSEQSSPEETTAAAAPSAPASSGAAVVESVCRFWMNLFLTYHPGEGANHLQSDTAGQDGGEVLEEEEAHQEETAQHDGGSIGLASDLRKEQVRGFDVRD